LVSERNDAIVIHIVHTRAYVQSMVGTVKPMLY